MREVRRSVRGARSPRGATRGRVNEAARDYTVPSVAAAARVLRWLTGRRATLSEISEALALSKSSTHGILKTLRSEGFLAYDEASRRYQLGTGLLALGESAANTLDHVAAVKPFLRELVGRTGLTGLVARPLGEQLLVVHKEEGTAEVRATSSVGRLLPPGAGAMGKVYLAFASDGAARRKVRLAAFTPRSLTDPARYAADLEATRERGFATSFEEYRLGVSAVAAPVFDHHRGVVLVLSLIGFATLLTPDTIDGYGRRLRAACVRASRELGGSGARM